MKIRLISFLLFILPVHTYSQTDADAIRFSMLNYGSTARSLGMANSFGALGADFSVLATNPAGIALYRRSEISFSPLFSNRNVNSDYLGNQTDDNFFKFAFGNFGVVWANSRDKSINPCKGWAFGIGYNKTNDHSSRTIAEGRNPNNSLLDNYLESAVGLAPADLPNAYPFDVNLAWETFLLDTVEIDAIPYYFTAVPFAGTLQRRTTETRGGQGEWDFTLGTNYNNMLYLGFTLGITTLRYEEETIWEEIDEKDTIPFFESFRYTQNLRTSGAGFNFKFGLIYRPADFIRFGAAIHSPTINSVTDEYSTTMQSDLEDGFRFDQSSPVFIPFDYTITTPFRAMGSMAVIAGQHGVFNIDYEYLNYNQARLRPRDRTFSGDYAPVNQALRTKYTSSHNIRGGFELRFEKLRVRGGAFYSTSPFKEELRDDQETDLSRIGFTGGLGLREEKYFMDIAYAWSRMGSFTRPYTLQNTTTGGITSTQTDNRIMLTFGFLF